MTHPILASLLVLSLCTAACSRSSSPNEEESVIQAVRGDDSALVQIRAGARALAEPEPSVDYVAAQMEGVIKVRTKSQALMHYHGYRVTLTTPGERVTQIRFDLIEAKPSVAQLTEEFGKPTDARRGMLYEYESAVTGATINILAEPVSMPADEQSLVRRILIEGRRHR